MTVPTWELVTGPVWRDFTRIVLARFSRFRGGSYDYSLSEESFRLDFAVALAQRWDYAHRIFPEYPCDHSPSQRLDLFVEDGPGYCFEFKFFRQIPSETNPPYTQHLGALWADLLKLKVLCRPERNRFLVVFTDNRFRSYFAGQSVFPMTEGVSQENVFDVSEIQKTASRTVKKRLPHVEIPDRVAMRITNMCETSEEPFRGYFLNVS